MTEEALFIVIDCDCGRVLGYDAVDVDYVSTEEQPKPLIMQHEFEVIGNREFLDLPLDVTSRPEEHGYWIFTLTGTHEGRDWETGIVDSVDWEGHWRRATQEDFDRLSVDWPFEAQTPAPKT